VGFIVISPVMTRGGHVEACVAQIHVLRGRPAPRDTGAERDAER
jgi:hypothetical protein